MTIQRIVEEKHVLPQTVVRNAMSLVEAYSSAQLVWVNSSTELNNYEAKSFFDVRGMNTLSSVEAPSYISPCIDSESQLPKNEELNETRELCAQQESKETITSCDSTCRENDHPYPIESGEDSIMICGTQVAKIANPTLIQIVKRIPMLNIGKTKLGSTKATNPLNNKVTIAY